MDVEQTLEERGSRYGTAEDNANLTVKLYETVAEGKTYHVWTPMHKLMTQMILHKISRMANGDPNYLDNVHDIVGYAKLLEDYIRKADHAG